jgi:hypothetical protein
MTHSVEILFLTLAFGLTLGVAIATVKGFGLIKISWLNFARLKELEKQKQDSKDPAKQKALQAVVEHCQGLRAKWILKEPDLKIAERTRHLAHEIASVYHPQSSNPLAEVRLGGLLEGFLELKNRIVALSEMQGVRQFTQFRLRHVRYLSRAWQKKEQWQKSRMGQVIARYKIAALFQWVYLLIRFLDLTFWMFKMLGYILHDIVLKILLIRWYLTIGELALRMYADRAGESELEADELLSQLDSIPDEEISSELPQGAQEIADVSRKSLMFNMNSVKWDQVKDIYYTLVKDLAGHYYPSSEEPLYEVKLYHLMMGVSRLSEQVASIRHQPVLNKLLNIRASHILYVRDALDFLRESELGTWLKKYPVGRFVKISKLMYKLVQKKHPGFLFKDFALFLAEEGAKRWLYIYLHDKIAVEANHAYKASLPATREEK